ncbi:U3 small nucleolar ribonucleoprotein protein MPP10-like [Coccinella septempunctata]|uniref:U3 small nucleolar ribonucleoprotein protein MPP10-like n=1 Tax=Coccinella septempunctata TaxID=41139 RepID=UPI001D090A76|nr:U3 small nucleolar ribonucleoprotein protein MPP10-like [Coccinella septempunctata]
MPSETVSFQNCEFLKMIRKIGENKSHDIPKLRKFLKTIYDCTENEQKNYYGNSKALPKLIIQNMDTEQIWQQLELQNAEVLAINGKKIESLLSPQVCTEVQLSENEMDEGSDHESGDSEFEAENDHISENEESGDISFEEDDMEEDSVPSQLPKKSFKKSVVDDEFFKLNEMEEFLISCEKEVDKENDDSEEEDEILFFAEEDDEKEYEKAITAKFKDFFRSNEEKNANENKSQNDLSEEEEGNLYSNFELRKERLQKKIEALENKAVAEKPWTLKGEIRADSRPVNSLLEEDVEFDRTTRPAPILTGNTTLKLEDIIRQRIKDKAFDDPQRKTGFVEEPIEFKKKLVLNQEKSKESLAQIYEKEYLAAKDPDLTEKEEDSELHKEIKTEMKALFSQLDALSNYHYTPKPAVREVKIVKNVPALNAEEVGPVVISDAVTLR